MNKRELQKFLADIELKLTSLKQVRPQIIEVQARYVSLEPDRLELYIPSGVLHDFYNGSEAIFSHIAQHFDAHLPSGSNWHRKLLDQMGQAWGIDRTYAVIKPNTASRLEEFRKFRHIARIKYGFQLKWKLIKPLVDEALIVLWSY